MSRRRNLRALTDVLATYKPKTWTLAGWDSCYLHCETVAEFHDLQIAFEVLTGEQPTRVDDSPLCLSQWDWQGWRISLSVFESAPLGMEPTA